MLVNIEQATAGGFQKSFMRWLSQRKFISDLRWCIIAEGMSGQQLQTVCKLLNVYADEPNGHWIVLEESDINTITANHTCCQLLLNAPGAQIPVGIRPDRPQVIQALARRGDVIISDPLAADVLKDRCNVISMENDGHTIGLKAPGKRSRAQISTLMAGLLFEFIKGVGEPGCKNCCAKKNHVLPE